MITAISGIFDCFLMSPLFDSRSDMRAAYSNAAQEAPSFNSNNRDFECDVPMKNQFFFINISRIPLFIKQIYLYNTRTFWKQGDNFTES